MTKKNDEFVNYVLELLQPLGPVYAKRMFGGHGIFMDGLMFALVVAQELYLKADALNKDRFEAIGLEKFKYTRSGKATYLSYYQAPDDALEDSDLLIIWAQSSVDAALRSPRNASRTT